MAVEDNLLAEFDSLNGYNDLMSEFDSLNEEPEQKVDAKMSFLDIPRGFSSTADAANYALEEANRRDAEEPKFNRKTVQRNRTVSSGQASTYGMAPTMENYDANTVESITFPGKKNDGPYANDDVDEGNTVKVGDLVGVGDRLYSFSGDDEKGHPLFKRLTDEESQVKTADVTMDGDVFRRMRREGRIKMDASALEQVRQGVLAETGREDVYGEGAMGTLNAVLTRATPYIGRVNADRYKWQLQKLDQMANGNFDGMDYISLYKADIFDDKKVDVIRKQDESEEDWQKRMQAAAQAELGKRVKAMQDMEDEIGATDTDSWDKILKGFVDSSGYALEFAVPGGTVGKMAKRWRFIGGSKQLANLANVTLRDKIVRGAVNFADAAVRANVVSAPVTLAEASSRYTEMRTPGFALDQNGNPYIRDMADSSGIAALKAIGGALYDTNVEMGLEPVTMGLFRLGKRSAGMMFDRLTPQLMEWLGKNYGSFVHSDAGRLTRDFCKAWGEFRDVTHIDSPIGEQLEENAQNIEKLFHLDGKESEYKGFAAEWQQFKNDTLSTEKQLDIFLGLIGQMIVGSVVSAYKTHKYHKSDAYQDELKQRRNLEGVLRLANVDEDTIGSLSDEQMAVLGEMWRQYSANPEELKKNCRGMGLALRTASQDMAYRTGLRFRENLANRGVEAEKFEFSTDERGLPKFQKIVRITPEGTDAPMDAMSDKGVTIVDRGDGTFLVMNDLRGGIPVQCDSFASAHEQADKFIVENQAKNLDNAQKTEYLEKYVAPNYAGRNIHVVQTVAQLRNEVLSAITSGEGYFGTANADSIFDETGELHERNAGGFHTMDGTTVLILDNIVSPADMERVMAHEAVGHEGVEQEVGRDNIVEFIGDMRANSFAEFGQNVLRRRTKAYYDMGFSTKDALRLAIAECDSARGRKEIMANYAMKRRHLPTAAEWNQHEENEKRRAAGEEVPTEDADLEVLLYNAEQKAKQGDKKPTMAGPMDIRDIEVDETKSEETESSETPAPTPEPVEPSTAESETKTSKTAYEEIGSAGIGNEDKKLLLDNATEEDFKRLVELHDKAENEEGFNAFYDAEEEIVKRIKDGIKASEPRRQASVAEVVEQAETPFSEAERTALEEAADMSGIDATDETPTTKDFLGVLSSEAPIVRLNPAKVDRTDSILPNMKKDANRNTGITKPLSGEWHPTMGGIGAAWLTKDGKLTVITGRHRSELAERKGKSMLYYLYREADGFTKEQAQIYDAVANIHDEKGTINDYIGFLDNVKPTREQAEKAGILYGKGLTAWSIYSDATEAVRRATALDGNAEKGQITPAQATIIAQAAPKDANRRNAGIQAVLLRTAIAGSIKGKAFEIYAKARADELGKAKINENLLAGEQMDLFTSPEDLAQDILVQRQSQYRTKKASGYEQVATNLRAALNREGKLELTDEYAKDLGVTDKTDREQLEKAYNLAMERADYWSNRILDAADTAAMNAEINAKADATAAKMAKIKAKAEAVKAGKPIAKETNIINSKQGNTKSETKLPTIEEIAAEFRRISNNGIATDNDYDNSIEVAKDIVKDIEDGNYNGFYHWYKTESGMSDNGEPNGFFELFKFVTGIDLSGKNEHEVYRAIIEYTDGKKGSLLGNLGISASDLYKKILNGHTVEIEDKYGTKDVILLKDGKVFDKDNYGIYHELSEAELNGFAAKTVSVSKNGMPVKETSDELKDIFSGKKKITKSGEVVPVTGTKATAEEKSVVEKPAKKEHKVLQGADKAFDGLTEAQRDYFDKQVSITDENVKTIDVLEDGSIKFTTGDGFALVIHKDGSASGGFMEGKPSMKSAKSAPKAERKRTITMKNAEDDKALDDALADFFSSDFDVKIAPLTENGQNLEDSVSEKDAVKTDAPTKTRKAFKLFRKYGDGEYGALFIDSAKRLKMGEWYKAKSPSVGRLRELEGAPKSKAFKWGKVYLFDEKNNAVPVAKMPNVSELNAATDSGKRYMTVTFGTNGKKLFYNLGINGAGTVAGYAFRPGWHATNAPSASHIGKSYGMNGVVKATGKNHYRKSDEVWCEIEIPDGIDYNPQAMERAPFLKEKGRETEKNRKEAQLDFIPQGGNYFYRTNSNADEKQDWIISGAIRITRELSREEVNRFNLENGFSPDAPIANNKKEAMAKQNADATEVDWDSAEFNQDLFVKRVAAATKVVSILNKDGKGSFENLCRVLAERKPEKYAELKPYLRRVWNVVSEEFGKDEVDKPTSERIFDIIEKENAKEAENGNLGESGSVDAVGDRALGGEQSAQGATTPVGTETRGNGASGSEVGAGNDVQGGKELQGSGVGDRTGGNTDRGGADNQSRDGSAGDGTRAASGEGGVSAERGSGEGSADNQAELGAAGRGDTRDVGTPDGETAVGVESKPKVVKKSTKAADDTKVSPKRHDFKMTKTVEDAILEPNQIKRVQNNIAAIRLIQQLALRDFDATPEEQETLAKYVGWGGLSGVFDHNYDRADSYEESGDHEMALHYAKKASLGVKGYELHREIKGLLDEDAYNSARASTTTAFYTPIEMVSAEHAALRALGLNGGRFLGPSAGVGNYASASGEYQNDVNWQFVEKDITSGMILKALFPNQRVNIMGYEETKFPDGFFDLAIDNVPYAEVAISDRSLTSKRMMIHDYFFAKTLSKLRPGGVMMFLTSTGTLDKGSATLRKFLSEHGGKIIGAVRMPNGFFSQNANTEAAADLVIVQKVEGEADNSAFEKQHPFDYEEERRWDNKKREWVTDKKPLSYNGYFADHPEQVIGKMEAVNGQFGKTLNFTMPEGTKEEMFKSIREAIDRALAGVDKDALVKTATVAEKPTHTPIYDEEGLRQGNITMKDGKAYIKSGDMLEPIALPTDAKLPNGTANKGYTQIARELKRRGRLPSRLVESVISLRKVLRDVVDAEMRGCTDEELKPLLDALNAEYDTFKAKYGSLHDKTIMPFVMLDKADGNRMLALEKVGRDNTVSKADIFTKRVISLGLRATKADTPKEALIICYSENGVIGPERVGELLGVSAEEAVQQLKDSGDVFENPQTGRLEPSWEYLSGHVRAKHAAALAAVESGDASFRKNAEALEKVLPPMVKLEDVEIKFGAPWCDPEVMKDFLRESFGSDRMNITLEKSEITGAWNFDASGSFGESPWGSTTWNPYTFISRVLNNESMESWHTDPVTKDRWRDEQETEANKLAAEKLHSSFAQFVRESDRWADLCFKRYNEVNNDNVAISLPNNIIPFKSAGMSEDAMRKMFEDGDPNKLKKGREYQSQVIARGVLGGTSLCLAHCVGAGKTMEMQAIGMLGRHLGMFKKSMYVVPNHMLNQFCNEFIEAFPNANILKMTEHDVKPENRRAFFAQVANGDWDAIVVKRSTFSSKLGMSEKYQQQYIESELKDLDRVIAELKEQGDRFSTKKAEKMKESLSQKLKHILNNENKDSEIVPFEELGVDQLFVDEAHNFKGLPIQTKHGRVKGLGASDSQRAIDLQMKSDYIQSLHNGDRGVVFATGTPLSNAPAIEAFVMLRFIACKLLKEQGLHHFDDFINMFGRITTESELNYDGKSVKEGDRITAFENIPELMSLFKSRVDIVNSEQLDIPRPKPKYHMIDVDMTPAQERIMEAVARECVIPGGKEWPAKGLDLSAVAKYACISPRLLGFTDGGNKIPRMVGEVKKVYDETSDKKGAQLIFTDIFNSGREATVGRIVNREEVGPSSGMSYNLNNEIKAMLVQQGIPESEIAIMQDLDKQKGDEDDNKEALFAKVRSGEVRILIGSRPRMGEGTNVQKHLAAIHLIHPGWKPSEDDQAIGRIIRFGNEYPEGHIYYYLTKGNSKIGSYEAKNHQLIGKKSELIKQVMRGDTSVRSIEMDENELDREMLMGLSSGNKALMELIDVKKQTRKMELNTSSTIQSAARMKDRSEANGRQLEREREEWAETKNGIQKWLDANKDKEFAFTTTDGTVMDKAKDISGYVANEVAKGLTMDSFERYRHPVWSIGNINGIDVILAWNEETKKFSIAVKDLGVAREIGNVGFVADFTPAMFTAFKTALVRTADPDYIKNTEANFADREKVVRKQAADAEKLAKEAEQMKTDLIAMRRRQAELEREVTPLMVKTTEDHGVSAYGNWLVRKDGAKVVAQNTKTYKRLEATSVKAIIPMIDNEDFGDSGNAATKTIDIPVQYLGKDRQFSEVGVGDVDFITEGFDEVEDFKSSNRREFEVWYGGRVIGTIHAYSRKQASSYIRTQDSGFPRDAVAHEIGTWNRKRKNDIITRHEEQIRAIDRQNALGLRKAGVLVPAAIRAGFFDRTSAKQVAQHAGGIGAGFSRNSQSIASLRGTDLFGVRGVDVNGWTNYSDGSVVIPLEGQTKYTIKNIIALNQVFPNTWRFDGFGEYNGKLYALAKTDKVGSPIEADVSIKHKFLEDNGFAKSRVYEQMFSRGCDSWEKNGIMIDANELVLGKTEGGETFAYNVPCSIRAYELESGNAGVDFMSEEFNAEEKAYSQSEDKTPTDEVSRNVFGMTNDDIAVEMRAAKLEPPVHEKKSDETLSQQAEVLLSRPEYMAKLSRAVYKMGRPLRDYETIALGELFYVRQRKVNDLQSILDDLEAMPDDQAASDPEYTQLLKETRDNLKEAKKLLYETGVAKRQGATEQGRALRSNRMKLDKNDLSFAGISNAIAEAAGGADRITPEMDAKIKELANDFTQLDSEGQEIYSARLKAFSEKVVKDIKANGKARHATEPKIGDEAKRVNRNYFDAMAQMEVHANEVGDTLIGLSDQMYPSWGRWLKHIGEYHCFMNPDITEEAVIKAIKDDVSKFVDGVDDDQIRDMLTGFGHNYRQSRYDSQRMMNDLRSQARMKRQLDYMNENNQLPPATGMVRDELSLEARKLAREVQERKKEVDETNGGVNRLKGALQSAKTRVKNRIEELEEAINNGEKIERSARTPVEDEELRQLKSRRDSLQSIYDSMFKTEKGLTEEQRVKMLERALSRELERTMEDYARAVAGDFSPRKKPSRVSSLAAETLRQKISETKDMILELKRAVYEYGLTPEEIAKKHAQKMKAREDAIMRMAERIERGDLRQNKKPQPPMDREMQKRYDEMGKQLKKAHQRLADMRLEAENSTVPKFWRAGKEYGKFVAASQRALRATLDFSATMRQAARITLGNPRIAGKSFVKAVRAMRNEMNLQLINDEIMSDPIVQEAVTKYGLHIRAIDGNNARDVEMFHGMERNRIRLFGRDVSITDVPLVGELMLKSERHYITYLNAVSAELYSSIVNDRTRFPGGATPWQKRMVCDMINMWNGSGALSKQRRAALQKAWINEVFWAPGLALSRIQLASLYDVWSPLIAKGIQNESGSFDPISRDERKAVFKIGASRHFKSSIAMIAIGALLKFAFASDDDWWKFDQADWFEKLLLLVSPNVGNTTIDLTGGEASVYRLMHTLLKGEKTSMTGRRQVLGETYGAPTHMQVLQRFMEGKLSPWLSELVAIVSGRDYTGEEYGVGKAVIDSVVPLTLSDIYEQLDQNGIGKGIITAILTLIGAGGSTYDRKPYENAVNPFAAALKEYETIANDDALDEETREELLNNIRTSNSLMRDEVREDIAADLRLIRHDEYTARKNEKRDGEPDIMLLDQIEQDKAKLLEKIRAARR